MKTSGLLELLKKNEIAKGTLNNILKSAGLK
jgi:hypothetical protein